MVEAMAEAPRNHLGGQQWGTFEGSLGVFTWGTPPKEPSRGKIMGGPGVNPLKTTLGGSPLLWKLPKVHWESPGWVREHRRVSGVGGLHAGPPLSAQGVQVHLDPLTSAEHAHGGEEPPGGDPNLPAPHDRPVPREEHLGGAQIGGVTLMGTPHPPQNKTG